MTVFEIDIDRHLSVVYIWKAFWQIFPENKNAQREVIEESDQ